MSRRPFPPRKDATVYRKGVRRSIPAAFEAVEAGCEIARTRFDLAVLAHARGDAGATTAHLAEAARHFRALGIPRWVERVEEHVRAWGSAT